jgi:hypothetical protein
MKKKWERGLCWLRDVNGPQPKRDPQKNGGMDVSA